MITRTDLDAAIAARLSGNDDSATIRASGAIFELMDRGKGCPLHENAMAEVLASFGIRHDGKIRSTFDALLAMSAEAAGDWHTFYAAAFGVWQSQQQAERARGYRDTDDLNKLIGAYLTEFPDIKPCELWGEFARRADGFDDVLIETKSNALIFAPHQWGEHAEIQFTAFRRRVQRIRASLQRAA